VSTCLLRQASFASHAQIGCADLISCVPTSGEIVPRLGISASFGENLGLLGIKGFFKEIVFFGIKLGKVVVISVVKQG